jgi:hypothetical protein
MLDAEWVKPERIKRSRQRRDQRLGSAQGASTKKFSTLIVITMGRSSIIFSCSFLYLVLMFLSKMCATLPANNLHMRQFFSSFSRLIASFLLMTVMTSGMAMAAYICPQPVVAPASDMAMGDGPCAGMDVEKPVHCASLQSASHLALEHLAVIPSLTPVTISSVIPAPVFSSSRFLPVALATPLSLAGNDPPYLRTQRLRI